MLNAVNFTQSDYRKPAAKDRGKVAEGLMHKHLTGLCIEHDAMFWRVPDAHAGSMTPAPADFIMLRKGRMSLIEVKETKHPNRLPHANFDPAQVGRMRLWKASGADAVVLIYHATLGLWRGFDVDHFITRDKGSWFFDEVKPQPLKELLT